jgi:hypothetical protein
MGIPIAIVAGAALIAGAVLITNHWQVLPLHYQGISPMAPRLNRWTGRIDMCVLDPDTMRDPNSFVGAELVCTAKGN